MGIQGLLPLLKPIQTQRHLSEFAGQTLAVDAYVWLHRGAYACATELATGKPTTRYVDFAMHRVRLLRHFSILPFLVFDGGPLPAKGGTEKEREKKRAENLEKGDVLAAQKKHGQAREHYVKCVDVTPQMAFQVIKALRAENVPYIVAPYEADAQLAYLERAGLVDGIITEDSDLLVFGCRNVHFKLDIVSATLISISRADFGAPALAVASLSLAGWSDHQFRWMAMLSGCDYLPSIPGVGLKTAWSLLRKYETVEKAVRALLLEGKKPVPRGYLEAFMLAEKVFMHQRVYDPGLEKLVYLNDSPGGAGLDETTEAYVGRDLEPSLAKSIAEGDACPISLKPMEDINSSFMPQAFKSLPLKMRDQNTPLRDKGKGKGENKPASKGILHFFTPVTKTVPKQHNQRPADCKPISAGRASGKRTLIDVMDDDANAKKKRRELQIQQKKATEMSTSRYFGTDVFADDVFSVAGPSQRISSRGASKENVFNHSEPIVIDDDDVVEPVVQEDGYLSPSPSVSRLLTPDFSSPVRQTSQRPNPCDVENGFDTDIISSPDMSRTAPKATHVQLEAFKFKDTGQLPARVLVPESPVLKRKVGDTCLGPDIQANFNDDASSEIGCWDDDECGGVQRNRSQESATTDSVPVTPPDLLELEVEEIGADVNLDENEVARQALAIAQTRVTDGWRKRFAFGTSGAVCEDVRKPPPWVHRKAASVTRRHSGVPLQQSRPLGIRPRRSDPYPLCPADEDSHRSGTAPKVVPRAFLASNFATVEEVGESCS